MFTRKIPKLIRWQALVALLISLLVSACTTTTPPPLLVNQQTSCLPALTQLNQLAHEHAGTLSDQRIPGTPWLRNNRFLHSFQQQALSKPQLNALLQRMNRRAINGLTIEIQQIPGAHLKNWQTRQKITTTPAAFVQRCARQLLAAQLLTPASTTQQWRHQLDVATSYSTLQRILGLYPLAAIPFRWGVINEQHELQEQWGKTEGKPWTIYAPHQTGKTQTQHVIKPRKDALNIPLLNRQEQQRLFTQHAPSWLIDSQSSANIPGTPYRQADKISVDTNKQTTYTHLSFGRWRDQITTQLNYIIWFTERPALSTFDWVAGKHDAVIFRVHLDATQNILAYDSIHLCGCWYRLFLPEGTPFQAKEADNSEPVTVEYIRAARQMRVYLSRDTHQIIDLKPVNDIQTGTRNYQLQGFDQLLRLPAFNRAGYVPQSERTERWFFWPMGVRNPGAVRRFGEHAISFIGMRHFDDPYLLREVGVQQ